jgi:methionyl-tRNA formyltransferase
MVMNNKKEDLRILFLGTPEFAVESLKALVENDYNVVGVVTMPDKPSGRGYKLQSSPVKKYALEKGLRVLQPENLKDPSFINELKALKVDLQIVVAFRMLPEIVWSMPPMGTFNLHSSLLPHYRGAAPINWAIINGEKETGVTTFFLSHEIDTGDIIYREKTSINDTDDAGSLHDRLMVMGAKLVLKTVDAIIEDTISAIPQEELEYDENCLKPAPKIMKDDCRINWADTSENIYNFIRGLSPYPTAWSKLQSNTQDETDYRIKVFKAEIQEGKYNSAPGTILTDNKTHLSVATSDSVISILELQAPGKKRMSIAEFLNGNKIDSKSRFI